MNREPHELFPRGQMKLPLDVLAMGRNSFHAEMELVGNLVGGIAVTDQLENLQFPVLAG